MAARRRLTRPPRLQLRHRLVKARFIASRRHSQQNLGSPRAQEWGLPHEKPRSAAAEIRFRKPNAPVALALARVALRGSTLQPSCPSDYSFGPLCAPLLAGELLRIRSKQFVKGLKTLLVQPVCWICFCRRDSGNHWKPHLTYTRNRSRLPRKLDVQLDTLLEARSSTATRTCSLSAIPAAGRHTCCVPSDKSSSIEGIEFCSRRALFWCRSCWWRNASYVSRVC